MAKKKFDMESTIREVQEYEKRRGIAETCGASQVQAMNCLVLNGTVSHVCVLGHGHTSFCRCACKHEFQKFYDK